MRLPPFPGVVLIHSVGVEPAASLALARALVEPGGVVLLLGLVPEAEERWWSRDRWARLEAHISEAEAALEARAALLREEGYAPRWETSVSPDAEELAEAMRRAESPLIIMGEVSDPDLRLAWTERCLDSGGVLAWPGVEARRPQRVLVPLALGPLHTRPTPELIAALAGLDVTLLRVRSGDDIPALQERLIGSPNVHLKELSAPLGRWTESLASFIRDEAIDLVLAPTPALGELGRGATARALIALGEDCPAPLLVAVGEGEFEAMEPQLECSDLLLIDHQLLGAVAWRGALGAPRPLDAAVTLIGRRGASLEAEVALGCLSAVVVSPETLPDALGLSPTDQAVHVVTAIAQVVRPPEGPVGLVEATRVAEAEAGGGTWWAVRLDPTGSLDELGRLTGALPLLDAEALLDDGPFNELPSLSAAQRLDRLARRLRSRGVLVDRTLGPAGLTRYPERLGDTLEALCGATHSSASALSLRLDNQVAREGLLALIQGATQRVHLQTYMVADDPVTRELAGALTEAAARGVAVRILVDSLLSLHGSLGQENPLLIELSGKDNVEVRGSKPVQQLPNLVDLKQRDHRKALVVDGARALLGGRNLGAPYFTGFSELQLTPETPFRDLPWLDASALLEGPVVGALDESFLQAWEAAGGAPFALPEPAPEGHIPLRLVQHHGLVDTHTLDLYRHLFEAAERSLFVVNTFPLLFELQRALLGALARGVSVRVLVGNVRPLFGERQPFPGGAVMRELATQVIHGRLDSLAQAGAEVWEFGLEAIPGWDPRLGRVLPHVHAKLVCVDGVRFTLGSANLDVTSAYWESEVLALVEHAPSAEQLERELEALLMGSVRVDPDDPAWQQRASRRGWLTQSWPGVVG